MATPKTRRGPRTLEDRRRGWVLALACTGQLMVVLDVSVVNVALPAIQTSLGFDPVGLQWVAGSYALAFAGFLLAGGRLADLIGHRRTFLAGLGLFAVTSLAGGLAAVPGLLIAARAGQGLAAALLAPVTLTLLTTRYPEGAARTRALAIWTAVSIAGGAGGNLLGGMLTEYATWRSVLLINVPIGMLALAVALRHLSSEATADRPVAGLAGLDLPGVLTATVGLVALTFGIAQAQIHGWGGPATLAALVLATFALGGFAVIETRVARVPLLPPALLANRGVSVGNLAMLLAGASFQVPMWYFLSLSMQHLLGFSPLIAGLGFLPHTLLTLLVGLRLTPWLMRRINHRALIAAGALLAAAGFAWQSLISVHSSYLGAILGPAVLIALGGGLFNTPLTATVVAGVHDTHAGAASGLMNTAKQAGGALGLAALTALAAIPVGPDLAAQVVGYRRAFLTMAALLAVTATITPLLPARRDQTPDPA